MLLEKSAVRHIVLGEPALGFSELLPSPVNEEGVMRLLSSLLSFLHMSEAGPLDVTGEDTRYFTPRGGDAGRVFETCGYMDGRSPGGGR